MNLIKVCMIAVVLVRISTAATKIFYVLPDNSSTISCPSHQCATFSQYFLDNDTLPVVSNVEYHLLPGKLYVISTEMIKLAYLQNFSFIGLYNKKSQLPSTIMISTDILIFDSYNVTIKNMIFKTLFLFTIDINVQLRFVICSYCTVENVTFLGCGLLGYNLIGRSYLTNIVINFTKSFTTENQCNGYVGIMLHYGNYSFDESKSDKYALTNIQNISVYHDSMCHTEQPIIFVHIEEYQTVDSLEIIISNSQFNDVVLQPIIIIKDDSNTIRCMVWIINCTFEYISVSHTPIITVALPQFNTALIFFNCKFHYCNGSDRALIKIIVTLEMNFRNVACTNITFNKCNFSKNNGRLLSFSNVFLSYCDIYILFIGPSYISDNEIRSTYSTISKALIYIDGMTIHIYGPINISNNTVYSDIMVFKSCKVFINGPITISSNVAFEKNVMSLEYCSVLFQGPITISHHSDTDSIILFIACDITFDKQIMFMSNACDKIMNIQEQYAYIKLMQDANITFLTNDCYNDLIVLESINDHLRPYPFCLFQYMTTKTSTSVVTLEDYNIIFAENRNTDYEFNVLTKCRVTFDRFACHCKWLHTSVFYGHNPGLINQQIIQIDDRRINHHTFICLLSSTTHYDCAIDKLGPVYPGQLLQINVFTPCSKNTSVIYAETHNNLLPSRACKIAHQTELLNTINNRAGILNFTIVSNSTGMCELFLTITPHLYSVYEAFYVRILPCPVGFALQNGICDCDPLLPPDIDTCYIEQSVIRRPVTRWINAHVQSNNTKYLTGNCPMDYCLPYSTDVLLTNPDTQCQFNRTGILCSQCQHPLSMVFGSSRCMKCTNLHILIAILIILAGIVLVTLMYLLNLTVTNGTINGIIFYANIISINDSVFLINDNVYKPLKVFISFTNLDLGIETCFYNGMDSYAKMWLQLFFPSYLIIIAVSIIIISRYSTRILRLTYTRSLPVLATLFLLSYTGVLSVVLTVLFSYSTITHLPSGHQQLVWSIDASVPLFGLKFTILFITCLVLFLLLIPFNIILLFRRYLSWFGFINHFKPILDAFQGSYKDKYYYWVGVHITLRSIFYALYAFQPNLRLMLAVTILIIFACCFGYIQPYKNRAINIQEVLLLSNLTILHAASYSSNSIFFIFTNVTISLAFIQFCTILLCHFLIYTCHCNVVVIILVTLKEKIMKFCNRRKPDDCSNEISLLNIPERTYNYSEYQDGLVSDDFKI